MKLTISGYSTALFATWYFIEELGLLLDAGDGVTSALLQKARKVDNVFISHADRDHWQGFFSSTSSMPATGIRASFIPITAGRSLRWPRSLLSSIRMSAAHNGLR